MKQKGDSIDDPIIISSRPLKRTKQSPPPLAEPILICSDDEEGLFSPDEEPNHVSCTVISSTATDSSDVEVVNLEEESFMEVEEQDSDSGRGLSIRSPKNRYRNNNSKQDKTPRDSKYSRVGTATSRFRNYNNLLSVSNTAGEKGFAPYKYVEVVRKKEERRKLKASDCPDCARYYEVTGSTPFPFGMRRPSCTHSKKGKVLVNKGDRLQLVSRHRSRYSRAPTPPGFWDIGFKKPVDEQQRKAEVEEYKQRRVAQKRTEVEWERSRKTRAGVPFGTRVYGSHASK